jgi:hypothetical protein
MRHLMVWLSAVFAALAAVSVQAADGQYTKLCMSGEIAGQGKCPAQPAPGRQAGDWACTRDNATQLVWSIDNEKGSWYYAMGDYPKAMNKEARCGFASGWRLPTRAELLTILTRESGAVAKMQALWKRGGINQPALDSRFFPGTIADAYWAADSSVHDSSYAWFVFFKPGFDNEGNAYTDYKVEDNLIRLVHEVR